jgi:hypothetical protein
MVKKLLIIFVLWIPFSLAAIACVLISLYAILAENNVYAKNMLRAMDKLTASLFGFDGYHTLSAECGASSCKPCEWLCWFLGKIQPGHCVGAARDEGLLLKID